MGHSQFQAPRRTGRGAFGGIAVCRWVAAVPLLVAVSACGAGDPPLKAVEATSTDPLAERGYRVTTGAAPGYVDDRICGRCHADLYDSYREVGMARSFYRPRPENLIEDFDSEGFFHQRSRRHYRMVRRDGRLFMQRHQLDASDERINEIEQEVDWILGSGNHSRTYLYRTEWGELYQLPIAWYTRTRSWAMAPGFDRERNLGLSRQVRRECMFCHNAYPEVPAGGDAHSQPHRFPADLPEGIGCQRCHGPGAEHSRVAMREPIDFERVYASIVNPGELSPRLRNDVCYGCHMQPSVAIPGKRRFGRADFSFRPGQPLSDYIVAVDVVEAGRERDERFEINHHPYRLEQSRCFVESEGGLSCLTCHDPHRKVPEPERAAHYRAACLGCHEVDDCRLEEMAAGAAADADDCATCHMPKRRTEDVVRVVMTDHRIRRLPGDIESASLAETDPVIDDVVLLDPASAPTGLTADLYRAYTLVELTGGRHAVATARLELLLPELRPRELEPYMALAHALINQRRLEPAQSILESVLERSPGYPRARELLGLVHAGQGRSEAALAAIREAVARGQERPEARFNLGVILSRYERFGEALPELERTVEMRPNMATAWFYLGQVQAELGRRSNAVESHRRAVALEPLFGRAYLALGRLLIEQGRRDEAIRYLRHGAEHAAEPQPIAEALAQAVSEGP